MIAHPDILAAAQSAIGQADAHFPKARTKKQRTDRANMVLSVLLGFNNAMIHMDPDSQGLGLFIWLAQVRDAYDECKEIVGK